MLGHQHVFVMFLTMVVITIGMTSAAADEVYDDYHAVFDSPSSVTVDWNCSIELLTVDSSLRQWDNIKANNLQQNASVIVFDSANDTVSRFWLFSSITNGSLSWDENVISCNFTVTLTKRSYALDGYDILSLDDVIDATLEMGGNVSIWSTIRVNDDHHANVTFDVDGLGDATGDSGAYIVPYRFENRTVDGLGGPVQWNNYLGFMGSGGVTDVDPTIDAVIEMPNMKLYDFNGSVAYATFDLWDYGIELPDSLNITVLNAGGIRILVNNGIANWTDIIDDVADELVYGGINIERAIQDTFDSNGSIAVSFDQASIETVPYERGRLSEQGPIVTIMTSSSDVGLFDEDDETLMGFLNSGGRARIETNADLSGYQYEFRFGSPDGLMSDPDHGERVGNDARWNGSGFLNTSLWISSTTAPSVIQNDTNVLIDIDLSDIALLARKMNFELNAEGRIRWMLLGSELQGGVPRNMEIEYVCADLIRLMYSKGLIDEDDIENITADMREGLEEDSPFSAGLEIDLTGYDGEWDINDMDGRPAVVFTIHSKGEMGLKGGDIILVNMISVPIEFELTSVEGWNTTYSILLPEGLSVANMEVSAGEISKTSDGFKHRVTIKIPRDVERINVKLKLNVGLMFLVSQFCMCFQALLLIVVLLSLIKVWKYVRERRQEKKDDELIEKGLRAKTAVATLRAARDTERRGEEPPVEGPPRDRDEEVEFEEEGPRDEEPPDEEEPPKEELPPRKKPAPEPEPKEPVPEMEERDETEPPEEPEPPVEPPEEPAPPAEPEGSPVLGRPGPQQPDREKIGPSEETEPPEKGDEEVVDEAPVPGRPPQKPEGIDDTSEWS